MTNALNLHLPAKSVEFLSCFSDFPGVAFGQLFQKMRGLQRESKMLHYDNILYPDSCLSNLNPDPY